MIKVSFVAPNFQQGPIKFNAYYLPYSPAVIWSYSYQFKEIKSRFHLDTFIWRRNKLDDAVKQLENSDIIGFSSYIWNKNYNYRLAKTIKKLRPNVLIVFGGPEPEIENKNFFKMHPYIDVCVKQEGEISFKKILDNYDSKNFTTIKGLLINDNLETIDTGESERISDLDTIPSPYLTGVFDKLISENPDITWNATLETNRGCPYACTFCDWGSLTYNKIKQFNLEKVFSELEWISKHKCDWMSITDANFGIFPERDNLIADKLIEVQKLYGYPKNYTISWAKNQKREIVGIVKKLIMEGGSKIGLNLSVQTLDENTLNVIKRKNLETNKIEEIFQICENYNIPLFTELILGLPGQTLDSFKQDFFRLFEIGNHTGISVYQAQILENAEMNLLQRRLYKIEGINVKDYIYGSSLENEIEESIEIVVATKDMPRDQMLEAQVFSSFLNTFHINGITNILSRFLRKYLNISYKDFYNDLFSYIQNDTWIKSQLDEVKAYYKQWSEKGILNHEPIGNIQIHGNNLSFRTVFKIQSENKHDHVFEIISKFIKINYNIEQEILSDLMKFQKNYLINFKFIDQYPLQLNFKYDILGYVNNDSLNNSCTYSFDFPEDKKMNLQQFLESIWFARRRNFGKSWIKKVV